MPRTTYLWSILCEIDDSRAYVEGVTSTLDGAVAYLHEVWAVDVDGEVEFFHEVPDPAGIHFIVDARICLDGEKDVFVRFTIKKHPLMRGQ